MWKCLDLRCTNLACDYAEDDVLLDVGERAPPCPVCSAATSEGFIPGKGPVSLTMAAQDIDPVYEMNGGVKLRKSESQAYLDRVSAKNGGKKYILEPVDRTKRKEQAAFHRHRAFLKNRKNGREDLNKSIEKSAHAASKGSAA